MICLDFQSPLWPICSPLTLSCSISKVSARFQLVYEPRYLPLTAMLSKQAQSCSFLCCPSHLCKELSISICKAFTFCLFKSPLRSSRCLQKPQQEPDCSCVRAMLSYTTGASSLVPVCYREMQFLCALFCNSVEELWLTTWTLWVLKKCKKIMNKRKHNRESPDYCFLGPRLRHCKAHINWKLLLNEKSWSITYNFRQSCKVWPNYTQLTLFQPI